MPRVAITVQDVGFQGDLNPVVFSAADQANGHTVLNDSPGGVQLHVKNDDSSPHTVTVAGVPDRWGHTVDLVTIVANATQAIMGPFAPQVFNQAGGLVNVDLDDDTSMSFAAVRPAPLST